jgi:hypothetical protein
MASSADSPRAVRIATLNTWGIRGNWPGRRRVLCDGLLALDADLLTLQETIVNGGYDQAADVLDSRYEIIHQQDRESDGQGISTASRWPVGEIIELDINVTSRIDYILIRCAQRGGPTLTVSNCKRTFDHPASAISDHYGLVADLTLPPQSPKTSRQPST